MRIRSFLYFIILVCHTTEICGQIVDNFQSSRLIPAPNAVGIDMFGEIPVSYYTGRANISVPLYSTVQRGVPFDMYLSYESSGVLVNSLHGWTGQSWTLFAGGNITRVVNGDYDENEYPFHSNSLYQKYFYRRSVWQELENYIKAKERKLGYLHVMTPCVGNVELYKTLFNSMSDGEFDQFMTDLRDGKKHLNVIPEPIMKIYFEKPEFRNHKHNK